MRRRIMTGPLPAVLAIAALLTLAMGSGAAAAPRRTAPPAPPDAPEPPAPPAQAWLGVELQDVDAEMAKALDLRDGEGALVNRVVADSPAAAAGLQDGDVIVSFDGQRVRDAGELTSAVRGAKPGAKTPVVVIRNGEKKTIKVELGSRKAPSARFAPDLESLHKGLADRMIYMHRGEGEDDGKAPMMWTMGDEPSAFLGVQMAPLTEQLGRFFGAPGGEGVLVNEVINDSPAAQAGIEAGDVILRANDRAISGPDDVRSALRKAEPGNKLSVTVLRDHAERTFEVTLGEPPPGRQPRILKGEFGEVPGPGRVFIHKSPAPREDDTAVEDEEAGDGERKIIIRRFAPEAEQGGDTQALREELQELRAEVERLREEMNRKR